MWALQPAMRAQVNIEVNIAGGTSAKSQNHGGPELDVRRERPVGPSLPELCQSFALERRRNLVPRGSQVPSHVAQNSRAGILCAVHAVTEAHQTLICVQGFSNEGGGVITVLDFLDHREHACPVLRRGVGHSWFR